MRILIDILKNKSDGRSFAVDTYKTPEWFDIKKGEFDESRSYHFHFLKRGISIEFFDKKAKE